MRLTRPVGTNFVLVRRVRAKNSLSMHESGASGASNGVGSRGPLKGPWRGPGAEPGRGSGGQRPRKLLGSSICKRPRKALLKIFFSLNQPTSTWYRNVPIKWHSSRCRVNFRPSWEELHLTQNWACFEKYLKIINYFENWFDYLEANCLWESSKMAFKF